MTARSVPQYFPNSVKFEVSYSPQHPHPSNSHKKGQPPTAITTLFIQKEPSIAERSEDGATLNTRINVLQHVVGPDAEDTRLTWEELETLGKLFIAFARDKRLKSVPYFVPEQRAATISSVGSVHRSIRPVTPGVPGHRRMHSPLSSLTLAKDPHTSAFHPGPIDGNTGTARERLAALTAKREAILRSSARPVLPPALGRQPPVKRDDPQPKREDPSRRRDATPPRKRDDRDRSDEEYSDSWNSRDGSVVDSRRRDSRDAEDDRLRSGHKTRSRKNRD